MNWFLGVATVYFAAAGAPLYCDRADCDLVVGRVAVPWVSLSEELYAMGWQCGDWVRIYGPGWELYARAYDSGPSIWQCVKQWGCGPGQGIAVDIPARFAPFPGLSSGPILIVNESMPLEMAENIVYAEE